MWSPGDLPLLKMQIPGPGPFHRSPEAQNHVRTTRVAAKGLDSEPVIPCAYNGEGED